MKAASHKVKVSIISLSSSATENYYPEESFLSGRQLRGKKIQGEGGINQVKLWGELLDKGVTFLDHLAPGILILYHSQTYVIMEAGMKKVFQDS